MDREQIRFYTQWLWIKASYIQFSGKLPKEFKVTLTKKYRCLLCSRIIRGLWRESPEIGTYIRVKCKCGNAGSSGTDWKYSVAGFEKQPEN